MIEIIKRGTKKTCTCDNCGCYFSYEDEDVRKFKDLVKFSPFLGQCIEKKVVKCPQCEKEIVLEQTK